MKSIHGWAILLVIALLIAIPAVAQTGNGGPSGTHYNLNVIGVDKGKTADMDGTQGHTIFVPLWGTAKILLCDSATCSDGAFEVLDRNGTDADGASFALPNPDVDGDGTTTYSVFARALGSPKNSPYNIVTTCAYDPAEPDVPICSVISMNLTRTKGPSKFTNVSKYLLYIYADIDADGTVERVPLFDDGLVDFYWNWENHGLRLAQLRFYPCSSTVPDPSNPDGPTTDTCNP
jgi:hypothetical protein